MLDKMITKVYQEVTNDVGGVTTDSVWMAGINNVWNVVQCSVEASVLATVDVQVNSATSKRNWKC